MNRAETTAMLSALVEKRLDSRTSYWAREVSFDRGTPNWRRIDYVGFKPYTPNHAVEPISVELGIFSCYEVKSCLADFESGNGLTFYGDENFLVTTRELAEQLHEMLRLPRNINQVLVPTPKGDRLQKLYDLSNNGSASYRHRPASEMLYAMIEAKWAEVKKIPEVGFCFSFCPPINAYWNRLHKTRAGTHPTKGDKMKIAHIYPAVSEVYRTAVKKKAQDAMAMAYGIPASREYRRKRVIQETNPHFPPMPDARKYRHSQLPN